MNRYNKQGKLGTGAFGDVFKMQHKQTGEVVAVKQIKKSFKTWDECVQLRELASLKKLKKHPNIVALKEVVRDQEQLFFIFEFMQGGTLLDAMKNNLSERTIRKYCRQIFEGLSHCHRNGFFHRDIKPENLLCGPNETIKIADFGCAREIRSRPPYTEYVSTRWYRAPELLLRSSMYNSPVDMWAMGCIVAELFARKNLFPGKTDVDTLYLIVGILGTAKFDQWGAGTQLLKNRGLKLPPSAGQSLASLLPGASPHSLPSSVNGFTASVSGLDGRHLDERHYE